MNVNYDRIAETYDDFRRGGGLYLAETLRLAHACEARTVLETLGREYEILKVYFKCYPSCRWTHAALDATSRILTENDIDVNRIASIKVDTFKEATALDTRRPSSPEGVQFSIPFTIALLLSEGEFGVRQMSPEYLQKPTVQALADKVQLSVDSVLDGLFPKHRPARVTITTDQGRCLTSEIIEVHGEPGSDFAVQGVKDKFLRLAADRLGNTQAEQIYQTTYTLDSFSNLEPLIAQLKGVPANCP